MTRPNLIDMNCHPGRSHQWIDGRSRGQELIENGTVFREVRCARCGIDAMRETYFTSTGRGREVVGGVRYVPR